MRADVGSVLQDLPGDLLDAGIVVFRRVWKGLRRGIRNKPLSLGDYKISTAFPSVWMSLDNLWTGCLKETKSAHSVTMKDSGGALVLVCGAWWGNSATHASLFY